MSTKKIAVCGDSYFSCDERYPGTHFSEIIADQLGLELINLARQGISNAAIRLQLDRAISLNPDVIIFCGTSPDRMEIPLHGLWASEVPKSFNPTAGIDNLDYRAYPSTSKQLIDSSKASMWSDHFSKFDSNDFDPAFTDAWKKFLVHMYDQEWKATTDQWIIESSLATLIESNIPFLYMRNGEYAPKWLDEGDEIIYKLKKLCWEHRDSRSYHSTEVAQTIFAEYLLPIIKQKLSNVQL